MGFTCSVCGKEHIEQLRDIRASLPDPVFELEGDERERQAEVSDDWCHFVDASGAPHYYVRGVIYVPIAETMEDFRFGVWVEVGDRDFYRLGDLWHTNDPVRPFFGSLANELTLYPETTGLRVALQLRGKRHLPSVVLLDAEHELVSAQRDGMTEARVHSLAEALVH